ncbi:MAG: D-glycerate dehydrogenase, partial [bacterium]
MNVIEKPRVWASFALPASTTEVLRQHSDFQVHVSGQPATRELLLENAAKSQGMLVTLRDKIDEEIIASAPNLRIIANLAAGVDNIDVEAATRRSIWVTNTPDVLTSATADLAMALLLAAAR